MIIPILLMAILVILVFAMIMVHRSTTAQEREHVERKEREYALMRRRDLFKRLGRSLSEVELGSEEEAKLLASIAEMKPDDEEIRDIIAASFPNLRRRDEIQKMLMPALVASIAEDVQRG